jgi:hypothetical protein
MISYPLQYQELLRKSVDEVTNARVNLACAEQDAAKAKRASIQADNRVEELKTELEKVKSILDVRIKRSPYEAVEQFKTDTGRYPI